MESGREQVVDLSEIVVMAAILSAQGAVAVSPRVEDLIGRMTLEEKVGQLAQRLSGSLEGKAAIWNRGRQRCG